MFSVKSIYQFANNTQNESMDSKTIRKNNLLLLIKHANSSAEVARRADTSPAVISQIISNKAVRNVGDTLARKIEKGFNLQHGWMDTPQTSLTETDQSKTTETGDISSSAAESVTSIIESNKKLLTSSDTAQALAKKILTIDAAHQISENVLSSINQLLDTIISMHDNPKITEQSTQEKLKELFQDADKDSK